MRLNVVAGSSNQPWDFNPHFVFFLFFLNININIYILLFLLPNQQEQSDASVASLLHRLWTETSRKAQKHDRCDSFVPVSIRLNWKVFVTPGFWLDFTKYLYCFVFFSAEAFSRWTWAKVRSSQPQWRTGQVSVWLWVEATWWQNMRHAEAAFNGYIYVQKRLPVCLKRVKISSASVVCWWSVFRVLLSPQRNGHTELKKNNNPPLTFRHLTCDIKNLKILWIEEIGRYLKMGIWMVGLVADIRLVCVCVTQIQIGFL